MTPLCVGETDDVASGRHQFTLTVQTETPESVLFALPDLTIWHKSDRGEGASWTIYSGPRSLASPDGKEHPRSIFIVQDLPSGEYFIVADARIEGYGGNIFEGGPVLLNAQNPNGSILLKERKLATLCVRMRQEESNAVVKNADVTKIECLECRTPIRRILTSSKIDIVQSLPAGKYRFEVEGPPFNLSDKSCLVPLQKGYDVDIPESGRVEVFVVFREEPVSEELYEEQRPFKITGIVKTQEGTPIPDAKIVIDYNYHSAIRAYNFKNVGPEVLTDEQGRFTLCFSVDDLKVNDTWLSREGGRISIQAKKDGYANLPYIKKENYQPMLNARYEDRFLQKPTIYQFAVEPQPKPQSEAKNQNGPQQEMWARSNDPANDISRLYVGVSRELEFILVPAAFVVGRIETDRDESRNINFSGNRFLLGQFADIGEDGSFQVSVLPRENMSFSLSRFDRVPSVETTPEFSLDKIGRYDVVLKWLTLEKNGAQVRKLTIASFKDPDGRDVPLTETPRSTVRDFMFLRWKIKGKVYDDTGELIPEPQLYLNTSSERGGGGVMIENVSNGEYEAEYAPTHYSFDSEGIAYLPTTTLCVRSGELGRSESVILSEEKLNLEADVVVPRYAYVSKAQVLDEQGNPLRAPGCDLRLGTQGSRQYGFGRLFEYQNIFEDARVIDRVFPDQPLWFIVYDNMIGKDVYWSSETFKLKPGKSYEITLRFLSDKDSKESDAKILTIEKIVDSRGNDLTEELVVKRPKKADRTVVRVKIDKIDHTLDFFQKRYTIQAEVVSQIAGKTSLQPGEKIVFSENNFYPHYFFLRDQKDEREYEIEFESEFSQPYEGEVSVKEINDQSETVSE